MLDLRPGPSRHVNHHATARALVFLALAFYATVIVLVDLALTR